MFRTVPVSVIRSFSLYTQQWHMSNRFADSLQAGSGWTDVKISWWRTEKLSEKCRILPQK